MLTIRSKVCFLASVYGVLVASRDPQKPGRTFTEVATDWPSEAGFD